MIDTYNLYKILYTFLITSFFPPAYICNFIHLLGYVFSYRSLIDRGRLRIGNREARALICMTHGHELRGRNASGEGGVGWMGLKRGKWKTVIA